MKPLPLDCGRRAGRGVPRPGQVARKLQRDAQSAHHMARRARAPPSSRPQQQRRAMDLECRAPPPPDERRSLPGIEERGRTTRAAVRPSSSRRCCAAYVRTYSARTSAGARGADRAARKARQRSAPGSPRGVPSTPHESSRASRTHPAQTGIGTGSGKKRRTPASTDRLLVRLDRRLHAGQSDHKWWGLRPRAAARVHTPPARRAARGTRARGDQSTDRLRAVRRSVDRGST